MGGEDPADKCRRLEHGATYKVWNERMIQQIPRNKSTSPDTARAAILSLLQIRRDRCSPPLPLATAHFLSDHSDVSGSLDNVEKLRNSLPELLSYESVSFDTANNSWLVDIDEVHPGCHALPLPLHIGRCPVYIDSSSDATWMEGWYGSRVDHINPFRICDDEVLRAVSNAFPYSMGMRVHKWGLVEILFASKKMLRRGVEHEGISGLIGDRSVMARVLAIDTSTSKAQAGMQIAATPDDYRQALGCLGLRIRRPGQDEDDWTTTTHAWMRLPNLTKFSRLSNWKANALLLARRSRVLSSAIDHLTGSEVEGKRAQTVLGNSVYLAGTRQKVGTITKCYDALPLPDSTLMFPLGLDYDLSLVTGVDLPTMELPSNCPIPESHFADPEEALCAPAVFLTRFNLQYNRWDTMTGHTVSGPAREALVVGMDYFWETRHVKAKRALIWRTAVDDHSAAGGSGSTLYLSSPSARTAKAIVFQNYETNIRANKFWELDTIRPRIKSVEGKASFKGGFLLPEEIRAAEIIIGERVGRRSISGPEMAIVGAAEDAAVDEKTAKRNCSCYL